MWWSDSGIGVSGEMVGERIGERVGEGYKAN